ncbi:arginine repressor [Actinomyces massiliensis]|jgi:arginine repressor, C-terminal domain protein|uniref:arginine repressor n=1 Tax=Actinomyces massiliensis TaxID=461393 RepID=UPI0028E94814|nr:arginine repressor [Actinomyces massiliensis]
MPIFRRQLQSATFKPGPTAPSLWLSFERIHHRIIVRTVAGGATYVAHKIDTAKPPDMLGSIAGNDSVIVICATPEAAANLTAHLNDILSPTWGPWS